jgi:outer membrane protein assembly factor BamD
MKKFSVVIFLFLILSSCGEYHQAMKSEDVALKYDVAEKLFEEKKYNKAIRLFEQIAPAYKGKPSAQKMFYMYAQSLYLTKQYYLAGYQFESFSSSYPRSDKSEEAAYLGALCFAKLSPRYSLDQVDTYKAIDKLQNFIDKYPESNYLSEANVLMKSLNDKIEKKAFENAKQYNTISDFKSAIVALDNFLINHPGTSYKEQALYYKLDSAFKLAINSVEYKMQERLETAKSAYNNLLKFNANTEFKAKADEMYARIENDLKQFTK